MTRDKTRIASGLVRSGRDRRFPDLVRRRQLARIRRDDPLWDRVCLAVFVPARRLRRILDAYPEAAGPTPELVLCRLPHGHAGSHLGLATDSWRREHGRWLRWGRYRYAVTDATTCDQGSADYLVSLDEPDWCQLPRGHRGRHSYRYFPDAVWPALDIRLAGGYAGHGADRRESAVARST